MAVNEYLTLKCLDNAPRLEVAVPNTFSVFLEGEGREIRGRLMSHFESYQRKIEEEVLRIVSGAEDKIRFCIRLVLDEMLANVVKHGKDIATLEWGVPTNDPTIEYLIRASDKGPGFDPRTIPEPTEDYLGNTEDGIQKPSGRGMQFIDHFSTEIGAILALIPADDQDPGGKRNGFELRFNKADSGQKGE